MSGVAFTFDSARRIAKVVESVSRDRGNMVQIPPRVRNAPDGWLVQCPSSLPGGYDGSEPLDGWVVERINDGTYVKIGQAYIQSINNAPLEADAVLIARLSGHHVASGTPRPLFLVDEKSSSGLTIGWYAGGTIYGAYGGSPRYTDIQLQDGSTLKINGHPWGQDAYYAYISSRRMTNNLAWQVLLEEKVATTSKYHVIPFVFPVQVRFSHNNFVPVVECRAIDNNSGPFTFWAWDELRLVPNTGVFRANLTVWNNIEFTRQIGFNVVSVNLANPIATSSGTGLGTF